MLINVVKGRTKLSLGCSHALCTNSLRPLVSMGIKRDKLNGTNGAKFAVFRRFVSPIFADFRFSWNYSIWEAENYRKPQIFAENRRKPQNFAETRRKPI